MTIDEAFDRILRGHWLVILSCILIPIGATLYLAKNAPSEYEAVARVQMGRDLAASNVQADATSQRVLGIATSPGVVRLALDKAGLQTDVAAFAANNVDVRRVGVSPVMEIAVTDTSPHRASVIASSITSDVIEFSNVGDQPTVAQRRKEVQAQLDVITKERKKLVSELANASPGDVLAIQAQLSSLTSSQTEYERQLSDLDLSILSNSRAVLLDPVRQPTIPLPKDTAQRAVLAGLLGALLGLGLAAALEALRPRLPSGRAIARALDAPHVGRLPRRDLSARTTAAAEQAADRLAMLAHRYEADRLFLVPVAEHDEGWARSLATHLGPGTPGSTHRVRCMALDAGWVEPGESPVAVVLAPEPVEARALARASALVDALGWPVLGVITYPRGRRREARSAVVEAPLSETGPLTAPEGSAQAEPQRDADAHDTAGQAADAGDAKHAGDAGHAAEPASPEPASPETASPETASAETVSPETASPETASAERASLRRSRRPGTRSASKRASRSTRSRARQDTEPGTEPSRGGGRDAGGGSNSEPVAASGRAEELETSESSASSGPPESPESAAPLAEEVLQP